MYKIVAVCSLSASVRNLIEHTMRRRVASLSSGAFLSGARKVVLLGPPGTGRTHLPTDLGVQADRAGHRVLSASATDWVTPTGRAFWLKTCPDCPDCAGCAVTR